MTIQSQSQMTNTRAASRRSNPDEVSPEFPQRHTDPGPDDVYDPDFDQRGGNRGGYDGPHYYDGGGDGCGRCDVLF